MTTGVWAGDAVHLEMAFKKLYKLLTRTIT